MSKKITFYYDPYEKSLGDGNYPQLKKCEACSSSAEVTFKKVWSEIWSGAAENPMFWFPTVWETKKDLDDYRKREDAPDYLTVKLVWKQMNWDSIMGLDGTCGPDLNDLLERNEPEKCNGIVNLNGKFIFIPEYSQVQSREKLKSHKEEAVSIIKHHTAMPYVLGGSAAKYQGMDATMEYLERAHPNIFCLLPKKEITQIIEQTIDEERT